MIWWGDILPPDSDNPPASTGKPRSDYDIRYLQYRMTGTPYEFVDGTYKFLGAWGSGSKCPASDQEANWDLWEPALQTRTDYPAPLSLKLNSAYDSDSRTGVLQVDAELDDDMTPYSNSVNKIIVLLYERNLTYTEKPNSTVLLQAVRHRIFFEDFAYTQDGQKGSFEIPFHLDSSWVAENMGAIAVVQNFDTSKGTTMDKLIAGEIHNSGFLSSVTAPPPTSKHIRPVSKP